MNSVVLEQEMKVAMSMVSGNNGEYELVSAERVELKVRELMGEKGKSLRKTSLKMRTMGMAASAWNNGGDGPDGSSFTAFSNLVASWKREYIIKYHNYINDRIK